MIIKTSGKLHKNRMKSSGPKSVKTLAYKGIEMQNEEKRNYIKYQLRYRDLFA